MRTGNTISRRLRPEVMVSILTWCSKSINTTNMKKYNLAWILIAIVAFSSCKKQIAADTVSPNLPATVPPSPLLRDILNDMYNDPFNDHGSHGGQAERNCQYFCSNYTYYGNNAYWDGVFHPQYATLNYQTLTNVINMEAAARSAAGSDLNPYNALGKFFRAYFF